MSVHDIVKQVLQLDPATRFEVVEKVLHSLDQPDPVIDAIWLDEAERRLAAHRTGKAPGIPAEDVFGPL